MSNGRSSNDIILGRGGGITGNITLLEPEEYAKLQAKAVVHLDRIAIPADDPIREALGLDDLSATQ